MSPSPSPSSPPVLGPYRRRYETERAKLLTVDWVLPGSVVKRYMPCGREGCSCQRSPPVLHGPYYQWTRKVQGKTVTVRLTREVAETYLAWIENRKRQTKILALMEVVALRAADQLRRSA